MHSFLKPAVSTKPVVILPLGLLFVPNDRVAFAELAKLIDPENRSKIPAFYAEAKPFIESFKIGKLSEKEFDDKMVALVKDILGKEITIEQFNTCWRARYDDKSVKDLTSLITESKNNDMVIYSFTNPKDEAEIITKCQERKIECTLENNHLKKIVGIGVNETFTENLSKVELFKKIAKQKYQSGVKDIILIIGSEDNHTIPELKADSEVLKKDAEQLNKSLLDAAESLSINVIKVDPALPLNMTEILKKEKQLISCKA